MLTLDAIVTRACAILDAEGLDGLTLRRLAGELGVGAASVYWHVDDKDELLELCCQTYDPEVRNLLDRRIGPDNWQSELRAILAGLFELIEQHPWVAELMSGSLNEDRTVLIWDRIGHILETTGLDEKTAFYATSLLTGHLGATGVMAAHTAYGTDGRESREERLARRADEFAALDPREYPFVAKSALTFREHTERDQYLGAVDLILDGLAAQVTKHRSA